MCVRCYCVCQVCQIRVGSWAYSKAEVDYQATPPPVLIPNYHHGAWWITRLNVYQEVYREVALAADYSMVVFEVYMKRNSLFYILNLIIPSFMMNAVMLVGHCKAICRNRGNTFITSSYVYASY